jgi:hypothetical protein
LFIGMMLFAAAGGAQGLSGADTTVLNNLLGVGVLGAAVPVGQIAGPTTLLPLTPATWRA